MYLGADTQRMTRVCAWCGTHLPSDPSHDCDGKVTHGICLPCGERFVANTGVPIARFLEQFDAPVVLTDQQGRVVDANALARSLHAVDCVSSEKRSIGEVFECIHARQPSGCMRQVHCSGCVLRQAITGALRHGVSTRDARAVLKLGQRADSATTELRVSATKTGRVVALQVYPIEATKAA